MEKLLEKVIDTERKDLEMYDITHGSRLSEIEDPNLKGKHFFSSSAVGKNELRLGWSLSLDWFNPYHNKASGKSASVGVIMMSCLNLPPHLRHKPENLYIACIIPGPKEPSLDEVNHFLKPIVSSLSVAYESGVLYSRTHEISQGRLVCSAIVFVVGDLPATRKVIGAASHGSNTFCALCKLNKKDINKLNRTKWEPHKHSDQLFTARQWRDASTQSDRAKIFNDFGLRWSELYNVTTLDFMTSIVVDGMHDLFLGLTQYHG